MATETVPRNRTAADESPSRTSGCETIFVDEYTDGVLDPQQSMLGPVRDGGHLVANTAPGCWGPMITPAIRGGHEVTRPVAVAGAEIGDAIAIHIKEISVTSLATSSGNDRTMEGRFQGDPYCAAVCPQCGTRHPETVLRGIGPESVRCARCGADATPFTFANGYTIVFDAARSVGVTLPREAAEKMARDARRIAAIPDNSVQNPVLTFAPHDLVGIAARLRPFLGQLGTTPAVVMPDSHNAGDFGEFLIGAPHEFALTREQLELRTDGHMDIDVVRAGATLICPVKVPGGGVYLGDMHALQGDGEIAGHTCDVAGTVTLQVSVIKNLNLQGPVLLPLVEDLPYLARPLTTEEEARALALAASYGLHQLEQSAPISIIGSGADLNAATENGLQRAAELLEMTLPEVRNRATVTGAVEIGRHPGVVQITFRAPLENLERAGLLALVRRQYEIRSPAE
ncbi:MAG: acetamidase/formamidase family protein [Planctomycetaceae bacterium]|jgi:acetamidase/formamidase